ncbi:hypothetical protein PR048_021230 [Dryococelus australis]|uniref:Ribosome-recycling factor, mitochondrial n=1 Tax=Dryococelus australis TaxID=614101 RepID=A0ABQ9GXN7_9NEOP|nr:hypothetical protein PR048_021230 [Dryococelus australis]
MMMVKLKLETLGSAGCSPGLKKKVVINMNEMAEVINVDAMKNDMQRVVDTMKFEYVKNLSLRSTTAKSSSLQILKIDMVRWEYEYPTPSSVWELRLDGDTSRIAATDTPPEALVLSSSSSASVSSLESLPVEFEGKEYTLQELAQIVRKNPKTIVVNMAVFPQAIPAVLQAIQKSGMNLNPQQDKTTLYIPVPKNGYKKLEIVKLIFYRVTREHRENLAKNAKTLFIKCRDSIKDVQNKYVKSVKSNSKISEDLSHSCQEQVSLVVIVFCFCGMLVVRDISTIEVLFLCSFAQIFAVADQYIQTAEKILEEKQSELLGKD